MKTYLVALDNSPVATEVLTAAMEMATKMDARLVLLRVVSRPLDLPAEAYAVSSDNVVSLLLEAGLRDLAALQQGLPKELVSQTLVMVGVPWQVICTEASARDVDLIIVGAHGHKFLDRLLGTMTERVVAHANQSVLVVRPPLPGVKPAGPGHA